MINRFRMCSMFRNEGQGRFKFLLITFILAVLGFIFLAGHLGIPNEDAAILYSYSRNLADTGVISYNNGGGRVEGATDFGWMLSIAFLQKLGISNHVSSSLLNAFFLTLFGFRMWTIKRILRPKVKAINFLVAFSTFLGLLLLSGALLSGLGGFSTIAQISLLATIFCSSLFNLYDGIFLGASIYYILLRPDSLVYFVVIIGSFLLVDIFLGFFRRETLQTIPINEERRLFFPITCFIKNISPQRIYYSLFPILVFASYWMWRWFYFQNPFPLPYYVKQVQELSLSVSVMRFLGELFLDSYNNLALSIVFLIVIFLYLKPILFFDIKLNNIDQLLCEDPVASGRLSKNYCKPVSNLWIRGVAVFLIFYIGQSLYLSRFTLMQNIYNRFHVPLLALSLGLLSSCLLIYSVRISALRLKSYRSLFLLVPLALILVQLVINIPSVAIGYPSYIIEPYRDNMYRLSIGLSNINYGKSVPTMFVTEAGKLSYYSRFKSIDTWGLNTPKYSLNPLQDPSDVLNEKPDIINMHVDFSRLSLVKLNKLDLLVGRSCKKSGDSLDSVSCGWHQMNQAIFDGAIQLGYDVYVVPFRIGAPINKRHDLFALKPDSKFAKDLRNVILSNEGIYVNNLTDLRKYGW